MFYICGSCYRGQAYCGDGCRNRAQLQQHRNANRKHQDSPEGRLDHRDRQRAYRARLRLRVTDATSAGGERSGTIKKPLVETGRSTPLAEILQDRLRLERLQAAIQPVCIPVRACRREEDRPGEGENMIHEGKEENGKKYTSVESEEEFHAALNRGKAVEADLGTRRAESG